MDMVRPAGAIRTLRRLVASPLVAMAWGTGPPVPTPAGAPLLLALRLGGRGASPARHTGGQDQALREHAQVALAATVNSMDLREQVTELRAQGLRQREIAAKVGKSQSRVSQLLLGKNGNEAKQQKTVTSGTATSEEPFEIADLNVMVADLVAGLVTEDDCDHCADAHGLPLRAGSREFHLCALCLLKLRQSKPGLKVALRRREPATREEAALEDASQVGPN
jgi:transcriptional regulator with XRE-family HTH domain